MGKFWWGFKSLKRKLTLTFMMFSWVAEPGITAFKFLQTSGNMENETLVHFIIVVSLVTCPAQPLSYAHHCNGSAGPRNDIVGDR